MDINSEYVFKNLKKTGVLLLAVVFVFCMNISVRAEETASEDIVQLVDSVEQYFKDYLPGISKSSKTAIEKYIEDGLKTDKDKYFMPLMTTLANMRKAGQAGQNEKINDVVNDFNKLSATARTNAITFLTDAFAGIHLGVEFKNGTMKLTNGQNELTSIKFNIKSLSKKSVENVANTVKKNAAKTAKKAKNVKKTKKTNMTKKVKKTKVAKAVKKTKTTKKAKATKKAIATKKAKKAKKNKNSSKKKTAKTKNNAKKSADKTPTSAMEELAKSGKKVDVTSTYFKAYIPGVSETYIENVKELIQIYSTDGGGPAGSGALWRCIREISELMGRKVDMAADYSKFTVEDEGITEFNKLTPEVQEKVIAKVKEGMMGIAVTANYQDGTFGFSKKGETKFTYTVIGSEPKTEVMAEKDLAAKANGSANEKKEETNTATEWIVIVAAAGVLLLVLGTVKLRMRKKAKESK